MRRVLLIDRSGGNLEALKAAFLRRGFKVSAENQPWRVAQALRHPVPEWEFVVIVTTSISEEDVKLLRELITASQQFHQSSNPDFLFAARVRCTPSLRVRIGRLGARYVRL